MKIRQATTDDVDLITEFNALMATETEAKTLDRGILQQGVAALLGDPTRGMYFIAEIDGQAAGQTMITYEWSDWRNGYFWWIQSVYVRPEHRGRGVFAALYRHVLDFAGSQANVCGLRLYVEAANDRAKGVYEHLGMQRSNYEMYDIEFTR